MKYIYLVSLIFLIAPSTGRAETLSQTLTHNDPNYDHSWYVGLALGNMRYQQSNINDFKVRERRLILGKQLSRAIAAEVHLGNTSSDTQQITGVPVSLKMDNYLAAFIKFNLTFESKDWNYNRFRLYGLLGGSRVKATSTDPGYVSSSVHSSLAGGVGMEFFINNIALQLGYTRYLSGRSNNHDYTLDSLHFGVIYQFGAGVANDS